MSLATPAAAGSPSGKADGSENKVDNRAVVSWCLFDFANQPFSTLIITFIYAAFFSKYMTADGKLTPEECEALGTSLWSSGMAVSAIAIACLSPILGAIADKRGYRKVFLLITTAICILASIALYFPLPGQAMLAIVIVVIGNVAFEMASVFYNAFLPDIASDDTIGKISGIGWAVGYVGGLVATLFSLFVLVKNPEWIGLSSENYQNIRASGLLVAIWFTLFSIPMFLFVEEDKSQVVDDGEPVVKATFNQLKKTFVEIQDYREVMMLLVARLVYNDGLLMIFSFGGIYAQNIFKFTSEQLLMFGLLVQTFAAIGAFGLGFLDDWIGGKKTILLTLIVMCFVTMVTIIFQTATVFWITGALIGIFVGPNQSSSRALMGRFVPPDKENEFFGFFAFSGKATAFMGPTLLAFLSPTFGTVVGFYIVVAFFLIGGLILLLVDEENGIRKANRDGSYTEIEAA